MGNRRSSRTLKFRSKSASKQSREEIEIDLTEQGSEIEFRPKKRPDLVVRSGILLAAGILLFLLIITVICGAIYIYWLSEAEPSQKIERMKEVVFWLLAAIGGALTALLRVFKRKQRR